MARIELQLSRIPGMVSKPEIVSRGCIHEDELAVLEIVADSPGKDGEQDPGDEKEGKSGKGLFRSFLGFFDHEKEEDEKEEKAPQRDRPDHGSKSQEKAGEKNPRGKASPWKDKEEEREKEEKRVESFGQEAVGEENGGRIKSAEGSGSQARTGGEEMLAEKIEDIDRGGADENLKDFGQQNGLLREDDPMVPVHEDLIRVEAE